MTLLARLATLIALLSISASSLADDGRSYNVLNIYSEEKPEHDDCKAIGKNGKVLDDVKVILAPVTPGEGTYEVELRKVNDDLYHVIGTGLYVETQFCHEYAIRQKARLEITSRYGLYKGKLTFER